MHKPATLEPTTLSPLFRGLTREIIQQSTPGELAAWCRQRRADLAIELAGPTCRTCGGDGSVNAGSDWCPSCGGSGIERATACRTCSGTGVVRDPSSTDIAVVSMTCPTCNGGAELLGGILDHAGMPRVYQAWTWDTYDALSDPSDSQAEAFQLATALASDPSGYRMRTGRIGLCLVGSSGTRKTGILVPAFGEIARRCVGRSRFISWRAWLDEIAATWQRDAAVSAAQMIHDAAMANPLMLDDFGGALGSTGREWVADTAWKLLEERQSVEAPMMVTTNRTMAEIERQYGEAVVSRLHALCVVLEVKGADERRA